MSRARRIGLIVGASLAGLVLVVFIAGIVIVQTDWFRNMVRQQIVSSVETATGGKVDIRSFSFDWTHLRAQVRDFVIHGLEPAGAPPLLQANLVQVDLKATSPFKGFVDIAYLLIDTPRANVIVYPDGHTNIPAPKIQSKSNKTGLETIVDLAIGKFDLRNGSLLFAERKTDLNASGENFRAQLGYNVANPSYTGEIDISPLHVKYGRNPGVDIDVRLPITAEKDKLSLNKAQINTNESRLVISGAMDHLVAPRTSAHLNGQISLEEVRRAAGLNLALDTAHAPRFLDADVTASMDDQHIRVQSARLTYGHSDIEASGTLKDVNRPGAVQFNSTLALGELGRLLRVAQRPEGKVTLGGNATLDANNDYRFTGNIDARGVSLQQGGRRLAGINLDSAVAADPHRIDLSGLRLSALGGSFAGSASLVEMADFKAAGNLKNFDIEETARAFGMAPLGYDGVVTGPVQASGNIKNPSALEAKASLGIAPGRRGVPVSGHLNVDYSARADTVNLGRSFLQLPHTRIDLSGALGRRIDVHLVSRNLSDFNPVARIPVTLNGGAVDVTAAVTGSLSAPRIAAQANITNFAVEGRPFTRFTAALNATRSGASVANAVLSRGALQAQFSGSVGLQNWKPLPSSPLRLDASVRNADVRDVLAIANQTSVPLTGALTADAHITGTVGSPVGNADLSVVNGTAEGERFDSLTARAFMTQTSIDIPSFQWVSGPSRIDANATYQHGVNDLERGSLRAHVASNQVQLSQFQALVKDRPGLAGVVTLNTDASANVFPAPSGTDFQLTALNANVSARNLQMEGSKLGDLTATASSNGTYVQYNVNSDFAGSTIRVNGQSALAGDHQTTANAQIANLPIDRVLAVAGRRDLPVSGALAATAQVSGTLKDPRATANLTVTKGAGFQQNFARLQAAFTYSNTLLDLPNLRVDFDGSYVEMAGSFTHPANDFQDGQVRFHLRSNDIQLTGIQRVKTAQPGLAGVIRLAADGAATLRRNGPPLFSTLDANIAARNLNLNKKPFGDLTATAETRGQEVQFNLTSDLAHANIRGSGRMGLTGDYPLDAQLTFSNVTYAGVRPLLSGQAQPFDASLEGHATVTGPVARAEDLRGTLQLTKLEAHSVAATPRGAKPRVNFELHNAGPIVVALDRSTVTVQSARITGPYTNLALSGSASLKDPQTLNLRADGNIRLDVLEAFDANIFSSGNIALNAAVTGTTAQPSVNGRLQLQNASFNMVDAPNGLTNGNGVIVFNGTQASIQSLTGESGGGKIAVSGLVNYGGPEMDVRLQATADQVRVAYPETVTTQINARLALNGTTSRSLLSGNVTISDVALHSHSDVGSILSSAATPPPAATASTGFLAGLRFDVKIQTAPDVQFRTTLTQNLQAEANLTLRGSPDHPGMLGRVAVTQGQVIFFGSKYNIDQGTLSFFNPQKINPILNIDLETTVQGVDVSISVTGPMDKMKLSYRSDPPMQFNELVSLLASGKLTTTDPVLAARAPAAPQQNFEQMGASTLLGQAVANPVSGRLQRLFGVSKLKIDPQITGASNTPQATLTLQQQITRELTFTYIQDITQSNPQIIRVEWAIDPHLSAIAQRDINGSFDLDFFYKKRFW